MPDRPSDRDSTPTRILGMVILFGVLLVVLVALQRREYPGGTFVHQERTVVLEEQNSDLNQVLADVVLGETTIQDLQALLGEPRAILEEGELSVWMFAHHLRVSRERALFGLVPKGSRVQWAETLSPVGVKGGRVIHTTSKPSPDAETQAALKRLWTRYHAHGGERSPPPRAEESGV